MELGVQTHFSQGWNTALLTKVLASGARVIRDSQPWNTVEKTAGVYSYTPMLTNYMAKADDAGISTILTFASGNALYDSGLTPYTDAGRQAFANYVAATLARYAGSVKAVEIWNEFNTGNFVPADGADRDMAYTALLKTVYETVKPLFPDVLILGGSSNMIATGAIDNLFSLGANAYMDAVAVHPYRSVAENVDDEILNLQAVMARYGDVKPIYATEFGYEFDDAAKAPAFLLKMVTLMSSVHVAEASWYALQDQKFFTNMGLYDLTGAEKPAASTFAFVETMLLPQGDPAKIDTGDDRAMIYRFGSDTYVMWGTPRSVTFAPGSTFYDARGQAIAAPAGLSYEPFVVRTSGYTLGETNVLADSLLQYGDGDGWAYFARNGITGALTPLTMVDWDWTSYLGGTYTRPLRINGSALAPGGSGAAPVQATLRYTSDAAQTIEVTGHWDVGTDGDGIDLHVLKNGQEVFARIFSGSFDLSGLMVSLAVGDTLDVAVGPNQYVTGDSTNYRVQLLTVPGVTLAGTTGNDQLVGGAGNDLFYGSTGTDSYGGGGGVDTLSFAGATGGIKADLSLSTAQAAAAGTIVQLAEIENLTGSAFADVLGGSAGDNIVMAGAGDDIVKASLGHDLLDGGAGIDTISFVNAINAVTVSLAATGEQHTGYGDMTLTGFENVTGSRYDDLIAGDAGDNVLAGGDGIDTLSYAAAAGGVTVSLAIATRQATGGAGADTISGFENLTGTAFADVLTGSKGDNAIAAGAGDDLIQATAGKDAIDGGAGSDTVSFEAFSQGVVVSLATSGYQAVNGGATLMLTGIENLTGSRRADQLTGDAGANVLHGGRGNDVLTGGMGQDTLHGDDGADRFVFASPLESKVAAPDRIMDFSRTGGDRIDLSGIDAIVGTPQVNDAFRVVAAFTRHAGELAFTVHAGGVLVQGDTNGDGRADFAIDVLGPTQLIASDFIL